MLSQAMKSPVDRQVWRDRGSLQGARRVQRERAAHSPGLARLAAGGGAPGKGHTHVHVVHGLGGHAGKSPSGTSGPGHACRSSVEVLQEALLLHGLTDGLKFLQGNSCRRLGSGQGLFLLHL